MYCASRVSGATLFSLGFLAYSNSPCRFSASAQDIENGIVRMSRKVTTDDVASYAHHLPKKEVKLDKKESMVYKKGVLVKAKGKTDLKMFQKVRLQSCREVQNYTFLLLPSARMRSEGYSSRSVCPREFSHYRLRGGQ